MSKYKTTEPARLAGMFKALGNPHRLHIFQRLLECCTPGTVCALDGVSPNCVGELGTELDIAASTLSHHIKTLAHAGLIHLHRRGQFIDCRIDPDAAALLRGVFTPTPATTARSPATKRNRT
jgi:ArsR family transcriptional regulator, arsenate/arsenite/antimonite-responsive transcriptional repressor